MAKSTSRIPKDLRKDLRETIRQTGTYDRLWSEYARMKFNNFKLYPDITSDDFEKRIRHIFPMIKKVKFYVAKTAYYGSHPALIITLDFPFKNQNKQEE